MNPEQQYLARGVMSFEKQRQEVSNSPYAASQEQWFEQGRSLKRSAPTPMSSALTTPQGGGEGAASSNPGDATAAASSSTSSLLQPFYLQPEVATQLTAGEMGVNVNDPAAVTQWRDSKVTTTRQVVDIVRAYHAAVIRPEVQTLIFQLEGALKRVDDNVFQTRKELQWLAADNRQSQRHQCGLQVLTTGWPEALAPPDREYMISWMLSQVPKIRTFLESRGLINDHNAAEIKRFLNVLQCEPTTIPRQQGFYAPMSMLSFKSWDMRQAFMEKYGGAAGIPCYKNESTPIHNKHIKVAPCSPQWQRKLEAPLRVVLSVINSHPDHNAKSRITVLWKTLTLMSPQPDAEFHEDAQAWARLHYGQEKGEFVAVLEVTHDLLSIMNSKPLDAQSKEESLWTEQWNKVIWGSHHELDLIDHNAFIEAKKQSLQSGKGMMVGKGRKHWSHLVIHNDSYSPYPFELQIQVKE